MNTHRKISQETKVACAARVVAVTGSRNGPSAGDSDMADHKSPLNSSGLTGRKPGISQHVHVQHHCLRGCGDYRSLPRLAVAAVVLIGGY